MVLGWCITQCQSDVVAMQKRGTELIYLSWS